MAQFTNQAQLSYNDTIINSNVAVGEILAVLSAAKTAVRDAYRRGDNVTYVLSILNSGNTALNGITITDDLGAYTVPGPGNITRYPLSYTDDSIKLYINGVLQAAPEVSNGPSLVFSGLSIPANSNLILVYQADVTQFAPLEPTSTIINTATVTGAGVSVTASETIRTVDAPELTITKNIDPVPVAENGRLTYTFLIQNYGNTPAVTTDNVSVTDIFDPILSDLTVTFNNMTWSAPENYTYEPSTGTFITVPGEITVPAATFSVDPQTGTVLITPGSATLVVTGSI